MDFDPQVSKALIVAIQQLQEMSPEIADILAKAKSGEMTEDVAMTNLLEAVMSDSAMADQFQDLMRKALTPLRDDAPLAKRNPVNAPIEGASVHFLPRAGRGLPQMNPLVLGALVERAQFDGDMPELRTGDIPIGVTPAVPVKTTARNPVAIGMMLGKASDKVQKQLDAGSAERRTEIEQQLTLGSIAEAMETDPHMLALKSVWGDIEKNNPATDACPAGALVAAGGDAATALAGTAESDPEGYRRGEAPKPIVVARPTGATMAKMPIAQRHEMAWRFLSTTQGRVSAVGVLLDTVAALLRERGVVVEERTFNPHAPRVQPLAYAEWTVTLAGPGATQPAFALVDVSSKTLAHRLFAGLGDTKPDKCFLEIESINRFSDREVGWMARLMPQEA